MTDWREHDGGPQPVDDDVWVEVSTAKRAALPFHTQARFVADWRIIRRYRFLNQHLIDAALKRGIELGLEAAAKEVGAGRWRWSTWENHPRMSQWAKSVQSAYEHCEFLIRDINSDAIAKETDQ